ncbi:MAG: hypothetical protein AUJ52_12700 [Elusimicrobia bacterium CG1_02_63_36]|nr:MAG: hypothetical protein AUJ52_12700 [Elusimicrobia bacterium CG1_02_63_36]PJA16889.1 MAG: hypothetical protein COX66_06380 [Elusimicrobia bacterium CG_4_10_14_0_2_um_filter_63_34]PJB24919.1 MAG: hypothetical protein CO113_11260 [Elusimicrobia bacterium CG_4_9_14_3_um_filter_62_55]
MKLSNGIWITLGTLTTASLLGIGLTTPILDTMRPDPDQFLGWAREVEPPLMNTPQSADEHVQTLLPTLFVEEPEARKAAIEALQVAFAYGGEDEISAETREEAAGALIEAYAETDAETTEGLAERKRVLDMLITQIGGETARAFTAQIVASASEPGVRGAALAALADKNSFRDTTVDALALEAMKDAAVPDAVRPKLLRRIKGRKAEKELIELLEKDLDDAGLRQTAVEIQNLHKPELLGAVISRLDQRGLLANPKTMPWFSRKLLSEHIRSVDEPGLVKALKVVWMRPSLTKGTFSAAQARLESADPAIRRMIARLVPDAVKYEGIDAEAGAQMLSARLLIEQDPAVKGQIEGSLGEVRKALEAPSAAPAAIPVE